MIDEDRFIYKDETDNFTIIEIRESDNLNKENFLEIDNNIYENDLFSFFRHQPVYLLHYSDESKKVIQTNGIIKSCHYSDFLIKYNYDKSPNSLYGPIFNSKNYKIIAMDKDISKEEKNNEDFKLGLNIKEPITKYIEKKIEYLKNLENIKKEIKEKNELFKEEITTQYKVYCEGEIKLFSSTFTDDNRNNCLMIYNGEASFLKQYIKIDFNTVLKENSILEIKLKGIENITDLGYMFYECKNLYSLPDFSKFNTDNVTNMSEMFYSCNLLTYIPDLSNWNTSNVTDLSGMFYRCKSLVSLPYISNWNTSKVKSMEKMFYGCILLESLPDISKWDTKNVPK